MELIAVLHGDLAECREVLLQVRFLHFCQSRLDHLRQAKQHNLSWVRYHFDRRSSTQNNSIGNGQRRFEHSAHCRAGLGSPLHCVRSKEEYVTAEKKNRPISALYYHMRQMNKAAVKGDWGTQPACKHGVADVKEPTSTRSWYCTEVAYHREEHSRKLFLPRCDALDGLVETPFQPPVIKHSSSASCPRPSQETNSVKSNYIHRK